MWPPRIYNGNPFTGKTKLLYWIPRLQIANSWTQSKSRKLWCAYCVIIKITSINRELTMMHHLSLQTSHKHGITKYTPHLALKIENIRVLRTVQEIRIHDDVIKWIPFRVTGPLRREITGHGEFPSKTPMTRGVDVFFDLICDWTNDKVNHGDAGDLRRHRAHYDVTVMSSQGRASYMNLVFYRGMDKR